MSEPSDTPSTAIPETVIDDEIEIEADPSESTELLELVLAAHAEREAEHGELCEHIDGIVVGELVGFDDSDRPLVTFAGCPDQAGLVAASAPRLQQRDVGTSFALMFESGDPSRPMIIGPMVSPFKRDAGVYRPNPKVRADGERIVVDAEHELVLRCGKSSITLTRAGKILLRGAYVSTHSSGVNRIKGGSVQIN